VVATGVPASYSVCVKLTIFITESEPLGSPVITEVTWSSNKFDFSIYFTCLPALTSTIAKTSSSSVEVNQFQ